ncbi:6715_t:CDS:2 [Ambispora gerdemannii]|uniref:6715_t:CDS:1 n=1 Tax=Ambispora gerdemannii TaxID=144530 RepID=A0A9N8YME9_9GLOM|nr:6715_t:CDS:2 [Ambispora gerdemannii]
MKHNFHLYKFEKTFNVEYIEKLFFFRHVATSQVLISPQVNMKNRYLRQTLNPALRSHQLRKDLWQPFLGVCGFKSEASRISLLNFIRFRLENKPKPPDYYQQPKRLREVEDMKEIEYSVLAFCEGIKELIKRKLEDPDQSQLLLFWEK